MFVLYFIFLKSVFTAIVTGRNICKNMNFNNANFEKAFGTFAQLETSDLPEICFSGRSNVGKSSLINMLTHNPKLAKTSQKPGKTLLINHFIINKAWYLVDLPGYGYAQRGKKAKDKLTQMIESYILEREQMTNLFLLIDIRHEPLTIDLEFIEWLGENGVPFSIIFTKADKLGLQRQRENVERYLARLSEQWEELPPHFVTSSEKGLGRDEVLGYIELINRSLNT